MGAREKASPHLALFAALAVFSTSACAHHDDAQGANRTATTSLTASPVSATPATASASPLATPSVAATDTAAIASPSPAPAGSDASDFSDADIAAHSSQALGQVPAGTTFDVQWQPQTVQIDAATVQSSYRGVGSDGALTFDSASAPAIAALEPGSVVVFGGLMIARVSAVTNDGSLVHVTAQPAALEDAVMSGHIAFAVPMDFSKVSYEMPPSMHRVDPAEDPMFAVERWFAAPAEADAPAVHYKGTQKGWALVLALTPQNGNLHMDLDASKTIDGGTIDVHGIGELDNLTNSVDIKLANGATTRITFDAGGLKGNVKFDWSVAFDKTHGGDKLPELDETTVQSLPFALSFPFAIGPVPFAVKIASGFAFAPTFSSKATVAQGSVTQSFGGDVSLDSDGSGSGNATTSTVTGDGTIDSYGGTVSFAPLGLSTTMMLPSIALGLGGPAQYAKLLAGGPYVLLLTQMNFVGSGPNAIAMCERRELNFIVIAGFKPGLLGKLMKPIRKEVVRKTNSIVVPANIRMCQPQ